MKGTLMFTQFNADRSSSARRPRRRTIGLPAAVLAVAVCVASLTAVQTPASAASDTTPLLGNTSVPRIPRDGVPASSPCPTGSFVVGARVWLDTFPRVTGFAALCSDGEGDPTPSGVVGDTTNSVDVGDSRCDGTDLAVGLKAANGEVINALGVRCEGATGTYDAAVVGNQTTIKNNADCDSGTALTGINGWSNIYGGPHINVYGVQGTCASTDITPPVTTVAADREPDSNGWYNHPFTASWSTAESGATCTTTTYSGPGTAAGSLNGTCTDAVGNESDPVGFSFKYDATAPEPWVRATLPRTQTDNEFAVSWWARDSLSKVESYDVRYRAATPRRDFGGFRTYRDATTATTATFTGTYGNQYCFSARARDRAGNVSGWGLERCTVVPLDDRSLFRSDGWRAAEAPRLMNRTALIAVTKDEALVWRSAPAGRVALVVGKGPGHGALEITYDGKVVDRVNLDSDTSRSKVIVKLPSLASPKTIRIRTLRASRAEVDGLVLARR